jgi:hypothetical protein
MPTATVPMPAIQSDTWLDVAELERRYAQLPPAPRDRGRVTQILARAPARSRLLHDEATLTVAEGVPGDRWATAEEPNPESQIAAMGHAVASMIANGQPLSLFGDNLTLDLDLSEDNLPVGSRVRIGGAVVQVTTEPHHGCKLYAARFGLSALRFISAKERRSQHLRGIYLKVVREGRIAVGDEVVVLREEDGHDHDHGDESEVTKAGSR